MTPTFIWLVLVTPGGGEEGKLEEVTKLHPSGHSCAGNPEMCIETHESLIGGT